jgi:hypothetical protein
MVTKLGKKKELNVKWYMFEYIHTEVDWTTNSMLKINRRGQKVSNWNFNLESILEAKPILLESIQTSQLKINSKLTESILTSLKLEPNIH